MARTPTVRWSESSQKWMAWVRFPDGSRRKVGRINRADAEADLAKLLTQRAEVGEAPEAKTKLLTFSDVIEQWIEASCPVGVVGPRARHHRAKSPNTINNARSLLTTHVVPTIGKLRVDRVSTRQVEDVFEAMAEAGYATSTIDRAWGYLNQACQWSVRQATVENNPAAEVLLPERRAPRERRSLSVEQLGVLLREAIPADPRPAMWLTGLMCGLRPGELAGLRWPFVDIDSSEPTLEVAERVNEVNKKYVGQAAPKTRRSQRRIGLHPLLVAALQRHRESNSF